MSKPRRKVKRSSKPNDGYRYKAWVITGRHGQKMRLWERLFTKPWPRDILQAVALQITDRATWKSFALVSKQCAQACRMVLPRQKPIILRNDPLFRYRPSGTAYGSNTGYYERIGGSIFSLVGYGKQDIYLTANPKITFFKVKYKKSTNFAPISVDWSCWSDYKPKPDFPKQVKMKYPKQKQQWGYRPKQKHHNFKFNSGR